MRWWRCIRASASWSGTSEVKIVSGLCGDRTHAPLMAWCSLWTAPMWNAWKKHASNLHALPERAKPAEFHCWSSQTSRTFRGLGRPSKLSACSVSLSYSAAALGRRQHRGRGACDQRAPSLAKAWTKHSNNCMRWFAPDEKPAVTRKPRVASGDSGITVHFCLEFRNG